MEEQSQAAVVVDNGSGFCKIGFSGQFEPNYVMPTVIGRPKFPSCMIGVNQKEIFVGEEALQKRGILNISNPIQYGQIEDWEGMQECWNHLFFNVLKIDPENYSFLITESPCNEKKYQEKMTQIMIEQYNISNFQIENKALLSMYATGITTGTFINSGYGNTTIVPILNGKVQQNAIMKNYIAGIQLTEFLVTLLHDEFKQQVMSSLQKQIVGEIKEQLCYIALDFEEEIKQYEKSAVKIMNYELPDSEKITVGQQRFKCPELIFQPQLNGYALPGIHNYIYQSIKRCDTSIQNQLYSNIILSGGNTIFPGFKERLMKEIINIAPLNIKVNIDSSSNRKYNSWIGGSILTQLSSYQAQWITKSEYEETGPSIIHKKRL